jgi:hypothetical protein
MARSIRTDVRVSSAPELDRDLRSECWSGATGGRFAGVRSEFAAPQFTTQRSRGARRRRRQLLHSRPSHGAEARFTPFDCQILL